MADGDVTLKTKLVGEDAGASKAFKELAKNVDHLHTRMTAVGVAIGNLASSAISHLAGMAVGAVASGLQTAAGLQQAQIGFTTMLGSAKAANQYITWMKQFAAATPFEMPGLMESARTLIGVGESAAQTKVTLQSYGDAASALGIQQDGFQRIMIAVSQSFSAGKIKLGDMNQMMNNGLPIWKLMSEAMGMPAPKLQDLISKGKLLSSDVLPKLQAQMEKDYGGAMAKQSQTLAGLWSTAMDTFHLGMASVLQPLIPILQKYLPGAMATMGAAFQSAATAVEGFVSGGGLQTMANIIKNDVVPSLKFIGEHKDVFLALAASATAGVVAYKAYTGVMGLFSAVTTAAAIAQKLYAVATREATVAQVGLDVAMDANPIGLIVAAVAALVVGLIALGVWLYHIASGSETFRNAMSAAFNAVKAAAEFAVNGIQAAWDALVGFLSGVWSRITSGTGGVAGIWGAITGAWDTAVSTLQQIPERVVGFFVALPGEILAAVVAFPGMFAEFVKTALEKAAFAVGFGLGMMVNLFFVWPGKVSLALASLPGIVWHWITTTGVQGALAVGSFLGGWLSQIGGWLVAVGSFLARLPGIIYHWITTSGVQGVVAFYNFHIMLMDKAYDLTAALISWVSALIPKVVGWFQRLPGMAVAAIQALPGLIKGVFSAAGTWLLDAGKQIVMGLVNGIKNAAGAALNAVKDLGGNIVSGFTSALGISSPSRVMAEEVGKWIPPGLAMGITQSMPVVYDALSIKAPAVPGGTGGTAAAGRGSGVTIQLNLQSGFIGSPDQLATALSDVIQRAKGRGLDLSFA